MRAIWFCSDGARGLRRGRAGSDDSVPAGSIRTRHGPRNHLGTRADGGLIADEHAVYDPELGADRMVLGIRGQMGEMELDSSIERMVRS